MTVPDSNTPSDGAITATANPYGVPPLGDELVEIECGFWTATPELQLICATAHERGVARWALLGAVLVNLISWLPPYVMLTDRKGYTNSPTSGGSLNLFVHPVADSGDGKTHTLAVARELVPPNTDRYGANSGDEDEDDVDLLSSGTGEGLLKHFVSLAAAPGEKPAPGKPVKQVMTQFTDVAVVQVDEVSTYLGELSRTGSKTAGILTSLWSGQLTGSNTSGKESRTKLPAHAARVCLLMLAQPDLCAGLFTDELVAGGTPQRPLWLPGDDWAAGPVTAAPNGVVLEPPRDCWRHLPPAYHPQQSVTPAPAAPMTGFPQVGGTAAPTVGGVAAPTPTAPPINTLPPELQFPRPARSPRAAVWIHQPPAARADIAALDGALAHTKLSPAQKVRLTPAEREERKARQIQKHGVLTMLKVMVGLALLHRRTDMQPIDQDWQLARVVMRVNQGMLAYLWSESEGARARTAKKKGSERGMERIAEREVVADDEERELQEVMDTLWWKHARDVGPTPATIQNRWFSTTKRRRLKEARNRMLEDGRLQVDAKGIFSALDKEGRVTCPPKVGEETRRQAQECERLRAQGVGV